MLFEYQAHIVEIAVGAMSDPSVSILKLMQLTCAAFETVSSQGLDSALRHCLVCIDNSCDQFLVFFWTRLRSDHPVKNASVFLVEQLLVKCQGFRWKTPEPALGELPEHQVEFPHPPSARPQDRPPHPNSRVSPRHFPTPAIDLRRS